MNCWQPEVAEREKGRHFQPPLNFQELIKTILLYWYEFWLCILNGSEYVYHAEKNAILNSISSNQFWQSKSIKDSF